MTLSRSRLIVFAVLAIAVTALLVDRLVLAPSATAPRQAGAAPTAGAHQAAGGADPVTNIAATADADPRFQLAQHLEEVAGRFELDAGALRDGFVPAPSWMTDLVEPPPPPEPEQEAAPPEVSPTVQFAERHTLTSVILISGGGSAVIDGKVVPLGQVIDGFQLVRLTRRSAVFASDGQEVQLSLRR